MVAVPLLTAPLVPLAAPAQAEVRVPAACAVPPDIDLDEFNVVIGTNRSEELVGTRGPDFICGRLGNDVILAFGGDDLVLSDTTTFFGDPGAAGGADLVLAGRGADQVLPGPGDDVVRGGPGADFLALAVGDDVGDGGPGVDSIIGGFGEDVVWGRPGNDFLAGGPGDDVVNGGRGNDFLAGELPPDSPPPPIPFEPARSDVCIGGTGSDTALDCDVLVAVEEELGS